jgi:putative ABC transport system ATP-binding protein
MPPLIRTRELGKTYRLERQAIRALDAISLRVHAGEMVAVTGPSGSGKSTLLQLLGCLDRASRGEYWFRGRPVSRLSDPTLARIRRQHIGFVFQNFNLLPRATALENVALPLVYSGLPRRLRRAKGQEALQRVGLGDRLHHPASTLSGGEQQRVAIARALVTEPALILADEPTGALDSATGQEILQLLVTLNRKGITVLMVTHDASVAALPRRQIQVRDGCLVSDRGLEPAPGDTGAGDGRPGAVPEGGDKGRCVRN